MNAFEHMIHHCFVQPGAQQYRKEVTEYDIEYDPVCQICGEPLAPIREVLAHIYIYLLEQSE